MAAIAQLIMDDLEIIKTLAIGDAEALAKEPGISLKHSTLTISHSTHSRLLADCRLFAVNFGHCGLAESTAGKNAKAVADSRPARTLLSRLFTRSITAPFDLSKRGLILGEMKKNLKTVASVKSAASNWRNWRFAWKSIGRNAEAKYPAASAIASRLLLDGKIIAKNSDLRVALSQLKQSAEADTVSVEPSSRMLSAVKFAAMNCSNLVRTVCIKVLMILLLSGYFITYGVLSCLRLTAKSAGISLICWGQALSYFRKDSEAVVKFAAATAILSQYHPDNKSEAISLSLWGRSLNIVEKYEAAMRKCENADAIFSRRCPDIEYAGVNLNIRGFFSAKVNKPAESLAKIEAADAILSRDFPGKFSSAFDLSNLGAELSSLGKREKAGAKYAAADTILSPRFHDDKITAVHLSMWGYTLHTMRKDEEAMAESLAADAVYSRLPTDSNTAPTLCGLETALAGVEQAIAKYSAADRLLFSCLPDNEIAACNLGQWGAALKGRRRNVEAVGKFEETRAIHVLNQRPIDAQKCDEEVDQFL